ncbi:class I SAM-dependent methyltransferase [Chryseolinea sp. T2]|uniref:O-methyltransferase n=1 Tax=Chryseolinea sp. T2 TaxID=3129255 RepID=UPI00307842D4
MQSHNHIEKARRSLLSDHSIIEVTDLGAGSKHASGSKRQVSQIAKHSLSSSHYSKMYYRALTHYHARHVLELGTSLGVNTMYLASDPEANVTTIEGSPEIARLASSLFEEHKLTNIRVECGNLDEILSGIVDRVPRIDFAFLDANHRLAPTLAYFKVIISKTHAGSIVVLDDIHSSAEMEAAWTSIKQDPAVTGTADLYRCGFVFFEPSLNSQHFVLQN